MFVKRIRIRIPSVIVCLALVTLLVAGVPAVTGQGDETLSFEFTPYEDNPVLAPGEEGEWDEGGVFAPSVIYHDDVFHMLYTGVADPVAGRRAMGYATSEDGLNWTRYADNPVLDLDESLGPYGIHNVRVLLDGDLWVIYICPQVSLGGGLCDVILRATAPAPAGPWTVEPEPVLEVGGSLDWDRLRFAPASIVRTDEAYRLYYENARPSSAFGLATSTDGITWTKYDDPETTSDPFASSDPVLERDRLDQWERDLMWIAAPIVWQHGDAWEMFYIGGVSAGAIGFATSADGITWTRHPDNPVLTFPEVDIPVIMAVVVVEDIHYLYYVDLDLPRVNVATGPITRGEE